SQEVNTEPLFSEMNVLRRFQGDAERLFFLRERYESVRDLVQLQVAADGREIGFVMPVWKLNVACYLEKTREFFQKRGQFLAAELEIGTDVVPGPDAVSLPRLGLSADRLYLCLGAAGGEQANVWYPGVPDHPLRGEILEILSIPTAEAAVGTGDWAGVVDDHWLVPLEGCTGRFLVGATYDRERVQLRQGDWDGTTAAGRAELEQSAERLLREGALGSGVAAVTGQRAGIRAGTRRRQVIAEHHEVYKRIGILNGLGSHGTLAAPAAAMSLLQRFEADLQCLKQEGAGMQGETAVRRRSDLTEKAQTIVRRAVVAGDRLLDATAGNGQDTLFLARTFGPQRVLAVDLQQQAIEKTGVLLAQHGIAGVGLVCGDHAQELERLVEQSAAAGTGDFGAVMFNLGYLPGGDHTLVTRADTTIRALTAARSLLRAGGVLTVLCYRGHDGGMEEYAAVYEDSRQQQQCVVDVIETGTGNSTAPVLFVYRKLATVRG
ncbi:MAG: class I SAM-dependent methyltransferase, partial [Planctomycetaceae bacterium]